MFIRGYMISPSPYGSSTLAGAVVLLDAESFVDTAPEPLERWRGPNGLRGEDESWAYSEDGMVLSDILIASVSRDLVGITALQADFKYLRGDYDRLTIQRAHLHTVMVPDAKATVVAKATPPDAPDPLSFAAKRMCSSSSVAFSVVNPTRMPEESITHNMRPMHRKYRN